MHPATGSVWRQDDKRFLVSNWHVLSGRRPDTGRLMDGRPPERLEIGVMKQWPLCQGNPSQEFYSVRLHDKSEFPLWVQHEEGQYYDIAAIELPDEIPITGDSVLPHKLENPSILMNHGTELHAMGFPMGLSLQGGYPVWKRGTIAGHPQIQTDGSPVMLVDMATREGMSGSPVFIVQYGQQYSWDKNGIFGFHAGLPYRFMGIYSGRYGEDNQHPAEFAAQLGRVWWPHLVEEMLQNPCAGSFSLSR